MLHITNGDAAANVLRKAGFTDPIVAWRDVLHEGPVPAGLGLRELSRVRAEFIAACGWGRSEEVARQFDTRDAMLEDSLSGDRVVLWFESDLYDQLQLCQVLAWYRDQKQRPELVLVNANEPRDGSFRGLGTLPPEAMQELVSKAATVRPEQLEVAAKAWEAFRSPEPTALEHLLHEDTSALPDLQAALRRLLQELPARQNGLSRTEHAALSAVAEGARAPAEVFVAVHTREERPFMGDWPFWRLLAHLSGAGPALLELASGAKPRFPPQVPPAAAFGAQRFRLTPAGREVLDGKRDAVATIGIDRWLGGTHLASGGTVWRWDESAARLSRD
jgi:hypothetical protein